MAFRSSMKSEKISRVKNFDLKSILLLCLRILQFVLALTVCGLYGQDLNNARKAHKYADAKWVYAVFCGGLSALSAIILSLPFEWMKTWILFIWDLILFILWLTLFGIFSKMYIPEKPEGNKGIIRMKHSVWVDLANCVLWLVTGAIGAFRFRKASKGRSGASAAGLP